MALFTRDMVVSSAVALTGERRIDAEEQQGTRRGRPDQLIILYYISVKKPTGKQRDWSESYLPTDFEFFNLAPPV